MSICLGSRNLFLDTKGTKQNNLLKTNKSFTAQSNAKEAGANTNVYVQFQELVSSQLINFTSSYPQIGVIKSGRCLSLWLLSYLSIYLITSFCFRLRRIILIGFCTQSRQREPEFSLSRMSVHLSITTIKRLKCANNCMYYTKKNMKPHQSYEKKSLQ